jgi:hypothetical protein
VADNASLQAASKEKATMAQPAAPAASEAGPRATGQIAATTAPTDRASNVAPKQLAQPSSSPPLKPSVGRADKPQAPPSGAGNFATGGIAQAPDQDGGALKSKLEAAAAEETAKKSRAEPFPAAPAESKNAVDALTATPPPTVAAAKPAPAPLRENAVEARAARSDEAPAAQGPTPAALAKVAPERQRAKDSPPRTPDEWIKLIRRLQSEGRKEEVAKELAAFRAEYKERADALLPTDLREIR